MKNSGLLLTAMVAALTLAGCKTLSLDDVVSLGTEGVQALSLTDQDIKTLSDQSCAQMDAQSKIAPAGSKYAQRLNRIAKSLGNNVEGTTINYKVYMTPDVNAWAMANGCVRVYSGLMDMMTDNELQGVLGHELGHVALGHTKRSIQVAYATKFARSAAAKVNNSAVAVLSSSQLGELAEDVINAQFSQSQESAADNYSYDYLKKRNLNTEGLASAFEKLGGGDSSLLSSHPASSKRAADIRKKIAADKK
ncbi:M48 family metallopeptidase [Ignatzschineria rhizosphaerae]|uniref:M48 family metallopeptidase n=1 Tax=Ignatzschineria rhizosphaerae TaxID=2923279 RepID=A0ABY3WZM6_9GAMM|nr:M48 family metallopeptidase [Ignatzschineria rhizosphaerae]UNM95065.1 M48 family metallopeptidase [Ignatzschineria rhizosphaerae]